jgi:hypothetical protein
MYELKIMSIWTKIKKDMEARSRYQVTSICPIESCSGFLMIPKATEWVEAPKTALRRFR